MSKALALARYGNSDPGRGYGKSQSYAANAVLTENLAGAVVDNRDATTPITLTLMPAVAGRSITFVRLAPYTAYLRPYSGDTIKGLTTDLAVNGALTVVLSCQVTGEWDVIFSGLSNIITVDEYRPATGNDRDAITAAWAAIVEAGGGVLQFTPGKTYDLGEVSTSIEMFPAYDLDVCIIDTNGCKFTVETTADVLWTAFSIYDCRVFHALGHGEWEDTGFDPTVTWRGVRAFALNVTTDGETYGPYTVEVKGKNVVCPFQTFRTAGKTSKIAGLRFHIMSDHCYYGPGLIGEISGVSGVVVCDTVRRAWITYGPVRGAIDVTMTHDGDADYASNAGIEIATSDDEQVTGEIDITVRVVGTLQWGHLVSLDNQTTGTNYGQIKGVRINYDLSRATYASGSYLTRFIASNRTVNTQVSEKWDRITITGDVGPWDSDPAEVVRFQNWPATTGLLDLSGLRQRYAQTRLKPQGMYLRDGSNGAIFHKYGDLTAAAMTIPIAAVNAAGATFANHALGLKITVFSMPDSTAVAGALFTYSEHIVLLDMVSGSLGLLSAQTLVSKYLTTSDVPTINVSAANITLTYAAYNGANALTRVKVEVVDRFGSIA